LIELLDPRFNSLAWAGMPITAAAESASAPVTTALRLISIEVKTSTVRKHSTSLTGVCSLRVGWE
jgi:hypothetical protein